MGDLLSSKRNENTNIVTNQQVALQGRDGVVGLGANSHAGDITIVSGDVADLAVTKEIALTAIDKVASSSNAATLSAIQSIALAQRSFDTSDLALDVATQATNSSNITTQRAFEALLAVQKQSGDVTGRAVDTAERIAMNAAPVSPGAYAEATQANNTDQTKHVIGAIVGIVAIGGAVYLFRKAS